MYQQFAVDKPVYASTTHEGVDDYYKWLHEHLRSVYGASGTCRLDYRPRLVFFHSHLTEEY